MKTGNPSKIDKLKNQSPEQDVNEKRNTNQSNTNKNNPNYKSNKGTGMSSEAGSSQNEKSWQDTGGSRPQGNETLNQSSRASGNMSDTGTSSRNSGNTSDKGLSGEKSGAGNLNTDNIKNQSDQQRRASMGDGTLEKNEKDLKKTDVTNEELNDADWNTDKPKK